MSVYKVTLMLNTSNMGASESYLSPDASAAEIAGQTETLLRLRNAMLFTVHKWIGVRMSLQPSEAALLAGTRVPRRSQVLLPGNPFWDPGNRKIIVPSEGVQTGTGQTTRPDQWRSVAQLAVGFNVDRRTIRYLSGIPDQLSAFEPNTLATSGPANAWVTEFDTFRQFLINNGWQIKARTGEVLDQILPVAGLHSEVAEPNRLGIVLPLVPDPGWVVGTKIHLTGFRRKDNSKVTLNGNYYVAGRSTTDVPGQLVYYLRGVLEQNPENWKVLGTVQRVRYEYFAINTMELYRAGIHKRGRPSLSPVGRRPTRVTLDP